MTIRKVVQVSINPGMADKFLEVASQFFQRVENLEEDTLSYEWFFDENHEIFYTLETYRDSEALLNHLDNIRDLYDQLFADTESLA